MSNSESLSAVRELLAEVVDSFEKLEIILYLRRTSGAVQTTAIAQALALPGDAVAQALTELLRDGLVHVTASAGWKLEPSGPATPVQALAQLYDDDRMEVLRLIAELALDRVRAHTAQRFADAFVIHMNKNKKSGEPSA